MSWKNWISWVIAGSAGLFFYEWSALFALVVNVLDGALVSMFPGITMPQAVISAAALIGSLDSYLPIHETVAMITTFLTVKLMMALVSVYLRIITWVINLVPTGG